MGSAYRRLAALVAWKWRFEQPKVERKRKNENITLGGMSNMKKIILKHHHRFCKQGTEATSCVLNLSLIAKNKLDSLVDQTAFVFPALAIWLCRNR